MDCNGGSVCKTILPMVEVFWCDFYVTLNILGILNFLLLNGGVPLMAFCIWIQNSDDWSQGVYYYEYLTIENKIVFKVKHNYYIVFIVKIT